MITSFDFFFFDFGREDCFRFFLRVQVRLLWPLLPHIPHTCSSVFKILSCVIFSKLEQNTDYPELTSCDIESRHRRTSNYIIQLHLTMEILRDRSCHLYSVVSLQWSIDGGNWDFGRIQSIVLTATDTVGKMWKRSNSNWSQYNCNIPRFSAFSPDLIKLKDVMSQNCIKKVYRNWHQLSNSLINKGAKDRSRNDKGKARSQIQTTIIYLPFPPGFCQKAQSLKTWRS